MAFRNKYLRLFIFLLGILVFSLLFGLGFVSATNCWQYTSNTTGQCTSANGCIWKTDSWNPSGWCEELNCWSLWTQNTCTTTNIPSKNCSWHAGGTTYGCERLSCWSLSGTNANTCVNNSAGLNCDWGNSCYSSGGAGPGVNCWNYQNQSSCLNSTGCSWGNCMDKGCWSYNTNNSCVAAKDWNGRNCTWENNNCNENGCWKYTNNESTCESTSLTGGLNCEWKWNSCQEVDCYKWDFTNETACLNNTANLSCSWSGSYCNRQDCWSYNTQSTCQNKPKCTWKSYITSGWCQEVQCWNWDSINGYNQTQCENNAYSMSCSWSGNPAGNQTSGWCYKNMQTVGCSNFTTDRACMDTYYCWWQYTDWNNSSAGGTCNTPGSFGGGGSGVSNTSILNEWNPGCYIFDLNSTDCNRVIGCNHTGAKCEALSNAYGGNITLNGLNCSYINNSNLCNGIPALSSCCSWQNGTCDANKLSSSCRDQMQAQPAGASFCEDYSSYENQALCEQIAGSPWYMPCQWINASSKCGCKVDDMFGNETQSLSKIDNKKNCEACGGKWVTESYCEGNISIPTGRCESKFDEEDNCDRACFACEIKDSDGTTVNSTNAATACANSKQGICEFTASTSAPNGIGYCESKEQYKKGIAGNCDSTCGDCTFKGQTSSNDTTKKPAHYCTNSKANSNAGGCKWIVDNSTITGGYCVNKDEKTCEDACDRCKTQTICSNLGRTNVANKTGSCKWQSASSTTGTCVANIGEDVEICWDSEDNNDDGLVDCLDPSCYADSYCGFVEGDCFGWKDNNTCISKSCEWITDKWGSFCDFKGSQCWKYNQNNSICNANTNCEWSNGTGTMTGWCEKDWSQQENCMGKTKTSCLAASGAGCNWTADTWCNGTGVSTTWCSNAETSGWCENNNFKPKNCWAYSSTGSAASCNAVSGCSWKTDQYSQPHCEVNWSANCWQYTSNGTCSDNSNCIWDVPLGGSGWCMNRADKCWSYDSTTCNSALGGRCYWQAWYGSGNTSGSGGSCQSMCWNGSLNTQASCSSSLGCNWKAENGWCEESEMAACTNTTNSNDETACKATTGCRWKTSGWCDPKGGGFSAGSNAGGGGVGGAMGGDCFKYDGNQTLCTNKTIINVSCGWNVNTNPSCEVNWAADCWKYSSVESGCNATNGCWLKNDTWGSFCTNIMDQCWQNTSYQSSSNPTGWTGNCSSNYLCQNNSWGGCEPKCTSLTSTTCTNATYLGKCRYTTGWCNPSTMNEMFSGMEAGAPSPLGQDTCPETEKQASVDICGFGMKDMDDSYGFGMGVNNFENASICNKEKLSSFVMMSTGGGGMAAGGPGGNSGSEKIGSGNETVTVIVYLDTDGSTSGGCTLTHNSSATGYEFRFKYSSQWNANTSKAVETFNSEKCDSSSWKATDIKISAWKKKMCGEIGGPMIAVKKADLSKYPTLYDSTKDMRVSVATIGNTGNVSVPTDTAGPGWTTPGSVDFDIVNAFAYGADTAKFENILKKGFVQGEDCFQSGDEDGDGTSDCSDWDCQYSSKCTTTGVNAAGYVDTSSPLVTGVKIEEYSEGTTGAVLIMYDTNKPTNGTLYWYGADSTCTNSTSGEPGMYMFPDVGIVKNNTIRQYKTWHVAEIYNGATKMNATGFNTFSAPVATGVTSYYKLKVCDANNRCSISKCTSFRLPDSASKCAYCNFVTRIKAPTGWKVAYDIDEDGTYEHVQGEVCGPSAGMKTNYTAGRKANVKLYKSDGSAYIEFLNASLTKNGLNDKVRTINTAGDMIHSTTGNYVGLSSETRDKIVNSLHPEVCRVKIPLASGATCDRLYHCDDSGANCVDRTTAAGGAPVDAANCVWNVPFCEFSTYKTSAAPGGSTTTGGGGGGGGGAVTNATKKTTAEDEEDATTTGESSGEKTQLSPEETGEDGKKGFRNINAFVIIGVIIAAGIVIGVVLGIKKKKTKQQHHLKCY